MNRMSRWRGALLVACWSTAQLGAAAHLAAQEAGKSQLSAADLVRETVAQEVAAAARSDAKHMFRSRRQTPKGSQTRLYVETDQALAAMTIAINDQPLSQEQMQAELGHLDWLIHTPEQLNKKRAREKEDADRTMRIVKALPDAFRYEYDGTETGQASVGKAGAILSRLKFSPNPSYSPPTRVEQVLQGMQGYLLIDADAHRIAKIDGTLFRDVNFGWGIIGHLDKGGRFQVQQGDVGDGSWEITGMSLKMTGKILLFKSISMISDETFSEFQRVPGTLSFSQGAEMLKSEQEKLAHSHSQQSVEEKK